MPRRAMTALKVWSSAFRRFRAQCCAGRLKTGLHTMLRFLRKPSFLRTLFFVRIPFFILVLATLFRANAAPNFTAAPAGNQGFDVFADGVLKASIRLAAGGAILADSVVTNATGIVLSNLHATDPLAVTFAADDYISITLS